MVRPDRFELPTFWFVGLRSPAKSCIFSSSLLAVLANFGAFAVIWVGIWVGKNPDETIAYG
jgi:hypothetical protein